MKNDEKSIKLIEGTFFASLELFSCERFQNFRGHKKPSGRLRVSKISRNHGRNSAFNYITRNSLFSSFHHNSVVILPSRKQGT